jgi:hypothetical protein
MKKILQYLKSLAGSETNDSSKRFSAIYTLLALITFVVVFHTDKQNATTVLFILCSFVLTLLGIAVWQNIRSKRIDKETK